MLFEFELSFTFKFKCHLNFNAIEFESNLDICKIVLVTLNMTEKGGK